MLIGAIVVAHLRRTAADLRIHAQPHGTPTVETRRSPEPAGRPDDFAAVGAWVLSSLPACFDERSRSRGSERALADQIPPADERLAPHAVVRGGGCRLTVRAADAVVVRGSDRLALPPPSELYRRGATLTLVHHVHHELEIRVYALLPSI